MASSTDVDRERPAPRPHAAARLPRWLTRLALGLFATAVIYGIWPYAMLWRLNQVVVAADETQLAKLVDLDAIRTEIAHALDKDRINPIGPLSDPFIGWLEDGLRDHGVAVLDERVTLSWVQTQLATQISTEQGLWSSIDWAFFEGPAHLRVRLVRPGMPPMTFRLSRVGAGWRITMLFF
ncbi:MAG: DUF2939 domain-containing protein [Sphingobacteriia bacterium]|nr:DUF2939 domain-containing protein [Sphingobacteriia bacterium]NCC39357.1 DUF2939 domain-containing protein [Gammaproteobacteria bacterium]